MMMKDIIQVGRREWRRILTRRSQRFLVLLLPVCLFLTLALIYKNGTVADIPVAICDQDHSELSRLLIRGFESTRSMKITAYVQSVDEIRDGFLRGQWHGAVFLPHDLEKSVKTGQPAVVVVYRNDGNLVIGNSILKEALTVSKTVSAGILIKKLRASGITAKQAMNIAAPIQVDTHFLYNPSYNYARYLTPGLLTAMLQMIAMMSAVLLFSTERREKTMDELFCTIGARSSGDDLRKTGSLYHDLHHSGALDFLSVVSCSAYCRTDRTDPGLAVHHAVCDRVGGHGLVDIPARARSNDGHRNGCVYQHAGIHVQRLYLSTMGHAGFAHRL